MAVSRRDVLKLGLAAAVTLPASSLLIAGKQAPEVLVSIRNDPLWFKKVERMIKRWTAQYQCVKVDMDSADPTTTVRLKRRDLCTPYELKKEIQFFQGDGEGTHQVCYTRYKYPDPWTKEGERHVRKQT